MTNDENEKLRDLNLSNIVLGNVCYHQTSSKKQPAEFLKAYNFVVTRRAPTHSRHLHLPPLPELLCYSALNYQQLRTLNSDCVQTAVYSRRLRDGAPFLLGFFAVF